MTDTAVFRRYEWQNKIIRFIFSFFIAIGVIVSTIAPFSIVKAEDTSTYLILEQNQQYDVFDYVQYGTTYYTSFKSSSSNDIRLVVFLNGRTVIPITVSLDQFVRNDVMSGRSRDNYITPDTGGLVEQKTYNDVTFYAANYYSLTDVTQYHSIVPFISVNTGDYGNLKTLAYRYAFGDLAVDPVPPGPDYGSVKDLSYSTNIVGSGTQTGDANIDTITWFPYWDSNDNLSTTWNMQIQVVPGTWEGNTNTDIFSQSYQDFIINESGATDIYRGTYLNGSVSISWGEVKNKLSILSWADLFQYLDGEYWNKKGWVYRVRYNDPDTEYWSDWQTVYTVTSSNGQGVENIIHPSTGTGLGDFNNNVENSYNTTSIVNNTYNVVYYYNGIPVDTNVNDEEITDYQQKIYEVSKQIRDILINLNTNNSTTENNDNDETITNNLNSVVDDFHNTEDQFMSDMDEKLTDIDNTFELLNNNKFIAAANWVRTQYDNIVLDTPFELLIVFGLILSLALVIIGKVK